VVAVSVVLQFAPAKATRLTIGPAQLLQQISQIEGVVGIDLQGTDFALICGFGSIRARGLAIVATVA
jgi:hypothetical protein